MGLEVQNSALNTKVSSGDSSDPVNQNILGKLIKEWARAHELHQTADGCLNS